MSARFEELDWRETPLGEVTSDRRVYRHREQAGLRIGEWRKVNLYRYMAWLIERIADKKKAPSRDASYIAHRLKILGFATGD